MRQLIPKFILDNYARNERQGCFRAVGIFLDIAGFSTMTDLMMEKGQVGAEVLAQVMNTVFHPLIHSVYAHRGFIATQAGDAFTALFPIEENTNETCLEALAAGWEIRSSLRTNPIYATQFGEFKVSGKVGIALGEANWGIITSADQQKAAYYFMGNAVEGCVMVEHQAQPGQVLLDQDFYEQVVDYTVVEPANPYLCLMKVRGVLPFAKPVIPPASDLTLAERFLPRDLFTRSLVGEFRQVAYLFISLPTVRTETQLDLFMETVFELQEQYGGVLNGLDFGDKGSHLQLFWGAPVALEKDVERALNFVLELQAHTAIPIHGGLTYSIAHAGFIGSVLHEEYTAYGRGANLSARFMTAAPRGEIWVDEFVASRAGAGFTLDYIGEQSFKGFSELQKVFALYEKKETIEPKFVGKMVGRQSEIDQLDRFIQPILEGEFAGLIAVCGEPGMGKSRLVHEFIHQNNACQRGECQVFIAQTDEILRESLNGFRYWLRHFFGVSLAQGEGRNKRSFNRVIDGLYESCEVENLAASLDRTRSFLGALVGLYWPDSLYEQLDAQGRFESTIVGLTTLLKAESCRKPVILILEDIHWLDEDSRAYLPRLVRGLSADIHAHYPIALVATTRCESAELPLDANMYQQIDLRTLKRDSLELMAEETLAGLVAPAVVDLLEDRADGNPLFAQQILRYLQAEKLLHQSDSTWELERFQPDILPADVNSILVAQLDHLAPEVAVVVQTAAVLGQEFDLELLTYMLADTPDLPKYFADARQEQIWVNLGEQHYAFRHALLREAAYQMQLVSHRQVIHAQAFQALENLYPEELVMHYGELAYHAEKGGLDQKARCYLRLAGDQARGAYQNTLAVDYYSRELALIPADNFAECFELISNREFVYEYLGSIEERDQDLQEMARLATALQDKEKEAYVKYRQADFAHDRGDYCRAVDIARVVFRLILPDNELVAVPGCESSDQEEIKTFRIQVGAQPIHIQARETAIRASTLVASSLLRLSQYSEAITWAQRGLNLATTPDDLQNKAFILNTLGMIEIERRDLDSAKRYFEESLSLGQKIGDLRAQVLPLNNLGMVAGYQGDLELAQDYYQQALMLSRQIGVRAGEGIILGNLGWISGAMGEYEQAQKYVFQSLTIAREVGDQYSESYGLVNLSAYYSASGECEAALRSAQEAQVLCRKTGDISAEAWALTYLGNSWLELGKLTQALEAYQQALEIRKKLGQMLLASEPAAGLAAIALTKADLAEAHEYLAPVLEILDSGQSLDGLDDPLRVYLSCYLVLLKSGDNRANSILDKGYQLLQVRLDSLKNPAAREAFIANIPHNAAILAAWQAQQATGDSPV